MEFPGKSLAQARADHGDMLLTLSQGIDPRSLCGGAGTIDQLIVEYLEHHAKPRKRTWRDDERLLNGALHIVTC